jgi:hypothetical protein
MKLFLIMLFLLCFPYNSDAEFFERINENIISIRAEGMGHAGVALHWGNASGVLSNPALISFQRGISYNYINRGTSSFFYKSYSDIIMSWNGIGFYFAKHPFGAKGNELEVHSSSGIRSIKYNKESAGISGNMVDLLDRFTNIPLDYIDEYLEVSVGSTRTSVLRTGSNEYNDKYSEYNYGLHILLTPINTIDKSSVNIMGGYRMNLAYGKSKLTDYLSDSQSQHNYYNSGWSLYSETGLPRVVSSIFENRLSWLSDSLTPFFAFGYSSQYSGGNFRWGSGWELSIANSIHFRQGSYDVNETRRYNTSGIGLSFDIGDCFGVKWDKATVPFVTGEDIILEGWSIWVNAVELFN